MNTTELMREDWDERARKDAFHYIASWRKDWNAESFFQSGEEDFRRLVAPLLDSRQGGPKAKSILELGCGAGRMTRSFAQRFEWVIAFDISAEMLRRARTLSPELPNVDWILGNGTDLANVDTESVDFVFSYLVLQHMPGSDFALRYIREMLRVLRHDGLFLFQFNSVPKVTMNWKGRMAWGLVDFPWALGFRGASRSIASLLGFCPEMAGKSWRGVSLDGSAVGKTVSDAGGVVKEITGSRTPMTWCCGSKPRPSLL